MSIRNPSPYTAEQKRVCDYLQKLTKGGIGCGDDPIGFLIASHNTLNQERSLFKRGLTLIDEGANHFGSEWCKAQAHGHLHDLDYDMYPETGKPEETK